MTIRKITGKSGGFSLIETLIAMTVMGVIFAAVMSVYLDTQRSAFTQQEVVDVQQNLRSAMARIAADIRSAGFLAADDALIDYDSTVTGHDPTILTILTASVGGKFARIDLDSAPTGSTATFRVVSGEMAALFSAGDLVRIFRPTTNAVLDEGSSSASPLTVSAAPDSAARTIPLKNLSGGVVFKEGDVIVQTKAELTPVTRIIYSLDGARTLVRSVADDGGTVRYSQSLASNLTALNFDYVLDGDDLPRTVEVTLTGATDIKKTGKYSGVKTRQLRSSFSLRNL